jgi:hypothetical protein
LRLTGFGLNGICSLRHHVYRPPDKTDEDYLNKIKEEISTIKEKHRRDIFVIGGDFNLPDIN